MIIQFKKYRDKQSTLTCIRSDGTRTWDKLQMDFELHDLAHFAIETELGFTNAFYGLLAKGYNIQDFALPLEQRPQALISKNLPAESLQTEHIANLLLIDHFQKNIGSDFINQLKGMLKQNDLAFPEMLTQERLKKINDSFEELILKWYALAEEETMSLFFNLV
ncbi:hypothetical protein DKG77_04395 [Flagellimonas aquimarina]|uniref:Uncharacterized protein n=1 Tax=Flagellimonas aquimarina TaxID=2201895 RepID=A0A316L2H8_9FLAO|nr:hypothetical protein [Allomuricauda koreensis]PWL40071.1 hypothetical protein DKG77_04395 [Allomuricauda koreensis]